MADEPRSVVPPVERPTAAGNIGLPIVGLPARLLGGTAIQITRQGLGATVSLDIGKLEEQSGLDPAETWVACWTESGHHFRVPVNIIPVDAPLDGDLYGRQNGAWVPVQDALTFEWDAIQNKPATFPPTLPIPQSGVTNLVADLAALAANSRAVSTTPDAQAALRDDVDMTPLKTKQQIDARLADETTPDADDEKLSTPVDIIRRGRNALLTGMLPFPGYIARSVLKKLGGLIDLNDFDTVNQALTAASLSVDSRVVAVPAGTFLFYETITVPAGIKVVDAGGVLKQANGAGLSDLIVLGDGATLSGVALDGNWTNNPATGTHVGIRIGASNDCTVEGCEITDMPGYGIVINDGKRARVTRNTIDKFAEFGIAVFGVDAGDEAHQITDNRIRRVGWSGIYVQNAAYATVRGNDIRGVYIGKPGSRLTVNTSGTTVTWASGPNFADVQIGHWVVLDNGAEYRVTGKASDTSLTVASALPTLSGAAAMIGSGDLLGLAQSSLCQVFDNYIEGSTTYGISMLLGLSEFAAIGNEIRRNKIVNTGKNGVNIAASLIGSGGGFIEKIVVADNYLFLTGSGAGIGTVDKIGIYITGDLIYSLLVANNLVASAAGDGQTTYWLGVDGAQNNGSVVVQGNRAEAVASNGIYQGVKSVVLSSGFGSGAAVSSLVTDGRSVSFTVTCGDAGLGTDLNFTINKIVEASTGVPMPKAFCISGSNQLPIMWGEQFSSLGSWVTYVRDVITPTSGQLFTFLMKD